jgi:thioester reductase-like protein
VLRLAATGRRARLHHVSTIGVFPGGRDRPATIHEDARADEPDRLPLGYMRTKWAAEELVHQARARGLTTTIFRPGTIAGDATTGAFNPDDFVCLLIKGCIELGAAPVVDAAVNLVPVDYVSRALVRVALAAAPGPYHLVGANVVAWTDLVRWLRALGYALAELPYAAWRQRVLERARATASSLVPLLPLFVDHEDTDWLYLPHYDDTAARGALAGSGIACAPVDATLIRRYIERFIAAGYLPRPS